MGKKDESFVRLLLEGLPLSEAARRAGVSEERARTFLESVATFAGSVGASHTFAAPGESGGGEAERDVVVHSDVIIYTDGASKGNPGPAGAGGVILAPDGETIEEFREHLGRATNNVAEYEAVRIGLSRALRYGAKRVLVRMDSELVANQLAGRYKIKDPKLVDQYLKVERLLSQLEEIRFETIPREENSRADRLAQMGASVRQ